jgi:hypothetical protein
LGRIITAITVCALSACALTASISNGAAKHAIKGELTLKVGEADFGLAEVSGKIKTKKICADLRAIRVKLLDPPPGYRQLGAIYGTQTKDYGDVVNVPTEPGTYSFQASARKTRVARGLKRAKCAKLKSPVVDVPVAPQTEF